jgi:serine/threonine protein kinase
MKYKSLDDYLHRNSLEKVKYIGSGEFGKVYLVRNEKNELFAIKVMNIQKFNSEEWELTKLLKEFIFIFFT